MTASFDNVLPNRVVVVEDRPVDWMDHYWRWMAGLPEKIARGSGLLLYHGMFRADRLVWAVVFQNWEFWRRVYYSLAAATLWH